MWMEESEPLVDPHIATAEAAEGADVADAVADMEEQSDDQGGESAPHPHFHHPHRIQKNPNLLTHLPGRQMRPPLLKQIRMTGLRLQKGRPMERTIANKRILQSRKQ